jgi:hypothetical protein
MTKRVEAVGITPLYNYVTSTAYITVAPTIYLIIIFLTFKYM